jgi:hypothetical protein
MGISRSKVLDGRVAGRVLNIKTMHLFVTYFDDGTAKFLPLLNRWLEYYAASGCNLPVSVLTDMTSPVPDGVHCFRADPEKYAEVMRAGNPFDRKSALICAALPELPVCTVIDIDAFLFQDPTEQLMRYSEDDLAVAEDAGGRSIPLSGHPECSSSVMVFGMCKDRSVLTGHYVDAWHALAHVDSGLQQTIREQVAWSKVADDALYPVLPRCLNWSRFWGTPTAENCSIYHAHGAEKWGELKFTM